MAKVSDSTITKYLIPNWAVDFGDRSALLPGGARVDPAQFVAEGGTRVVTSGAAQGAVSVPVTALTNAIPSGTLLYFASGKYARTTANAAAGATSIAVEALPVALANLDTATYNPPGARYVIPSGTVVGRTRAERDAGTAYGPAASGDEEVYILFHDIEDAVVNPDATLYRHYKGVKENQLPNWAGLGATVQGFVRSFYETTRGID
jgi:hypothetical protein